MSRLRRWRLWPVDGQGSRSWSYCEAQVRGQLCTIREPHGYQHATAAGLRFAA